MPLDTKYDLPPDRCYLISSIRDHWVSYMDSDKNSKVAKELVNNPQLPHFPPTHTP